MQQSVMVGPMLCYGGGIGHTLCCTLCIPDCAAYLFFNFVVKCVVTQYI